MASNEEEPVVSDEEESIYKILPPEFTPPIKPPMYVSNHDPHLPPTASTFCLFGTSLSDLINLAGSGSPPVRSKHGRLKEHGTMGELPGIKKPDPTNILKKHANAKRVMKLSEIKNTQPNMLKIKERKKEMKPGVPETTEVPLMNLRSGKHYITANAVDAILACPPKKAEEEDGLKYLSKTDYGKVPEYLGDIKKNILSELEYVEKFKSAEVSEQERQKGGGLRLLGDPEKQNLIEGLKNRWSDLNRDYQSSTHIVKLDTIGKIKRKEYFETTLTQIEKDLEKLNRKYIFINAN